VETNETRNFVIYNYNYNYNYNNNNNNNNYCPSARCATAANVVCKDVDVFGAGNVHLNKFL
jgi:hypothetical protein